MDFITVDRVIWLQEVECIGHWSRLVVASLDDGSASDAAIPAAACRHWQAVIPALIGQVSPWCVAVVLVCL